jgi:PAS domain S-box-containing protein
VAYFAFVLVLVATVALAGALASSARSTSNAITKATADTTLTATRAASEIANVLPIYQAFVDRVAAIPTVSAVFDPRAAGPPCSLAFSTSGLFTSGHADAIAPDGTVVCSSVTPLPKGPVYGTAGWLAEAVNAPVVVAPVADPRTGGMAVVTTAVIPGRGIIAVFVDLAGLGPNLSARFGTSLNEGFLVTSAEGSTAIASSIDPVKWPGASLSGTAFAANLSQVERADLDGALRIYGTADVPKVGWHVYAGVLRAAVVRAANDEATANLYGAGVVLLALLAGLFVLYRGVARPMRELAKEIAAGGVERFAQRPLTPAGPTELVALGNEINALSARVIEELKDRREAEHAARGLAAIVESSVDAIIGKTLAGVITDWNSAAERLYGYTAAEAVGRSISMLVPSDRDDEIPALLAQLSRGEQIERFRTVRRCKNGSLVNVSLSMSPTRDESGAIVGASTIARDVTDAVREQAALDSLREVAFAAGRTLDAERLVRLTTEQVRSALGVDNAVVQWLEDKTGILRPIGDPGSVGSEELPPNYEQRSGESLAGRVFERGTPLVINDYPSWPHANPAFRRAIASVVSVPMLVGQRTLGVLSAMSGTPRVFTDRDVHLLTLFASEVAPVIEAGRLLAEAEKRRAEAESSEARFSAYFHGSPVASLTARLADNRTLDVNEAFTSLLGYSREELVGRDPLVVGFFADPQELFGILEALKEQPQVRAETRLRRKDGEVRTVMAFVQPTLIAGERCVIVGAFDLTDQRRASALEQRQFAIEEASRAKSAFLASMSHELRTPLNAILGFSKLVLEQAKLENRHYGYIEHVRDAGEQLLDLINDVLDLARVESGKMELRRESVALATLLEPVVVTTRLAAESRALLFEVSAPDDAVVVLDPGRMRQILNNLLSNAIKFTQPGGRICLSAAVTGGALEIEVSDTGIGIPQESRDRVFGTFERLHEGRIDAGGTGLGLALTKEMVELHGGTITFDSTAGVGTTFHVRIPLPAHESVAGDRVLVVEDDPRDAGLVVALAEAAGLRTEVVGTLADALAALRYNRPIGLVVDLRLPDGRGETLLEAARDGLLARVPTIVVTVEDAARVEALGVDAYLTKPIDVERLNRWLAGVARTREVAVAHPAR